jgi:hypothetical protein
MPCLETLLKMITDKHSSDLRASASLAISKMFIACLDAIKKNFITVKNDELEFVLNTCLLKLLECINGDINATSRSCAVDSLRDILQSCYTSGDETCDGLFVNFVTKPNLSICEKLVMELLSQCQQSLERRNKRVEQLFKSSKEGCLFTVYILNYFLLI